MQIDSLKIKVGDQWKEAQKIFVKTSSGWKESSNFYQKINNEWVSLVKPPVNNIILVDLADAVAGDVCLWDGTKKLFGRFVDSDATDNITNYTPIGIVAVPYNHSDTKAVRIMSLAVMDCNNPETGNTTENVDIQWGGTGEKATSDPYSSYGGYFSRASSPSFPETESIQGWIQGGSIHIPSDYHQDGIQNPYNNEYYGTDSYDYLGPSPYNSDRSKNEVYRTNYPNISYRSYTASMDGKRNSENILATDNATDASWQTADTINNAGSTSYIHPAAQCCWRFHTAGTVQGDWYLPSTCEMGYVIARYKIISSSINKLKDSGFDVLPMPINSTDSNVYYHTSNECNSTECLTAFVADDHCGLGRSDKYHGDSWLDWGFVWCVRAFCEITVPSTMNSGVYIMHYTGGIYSVDQWDTSDNSNAIAVLLITDKCRFAISRYLDIENYIPWSESLSNVSVNGMLTSAYESAAKSDFNGKYHTELIVAQSTTEDSSNNAAHYCRSQSLYGNGRGYLPSVGELYTLWENKTAIDNALTLVGAETINDKITELSPSLGGIFWTSTGHSASAIWGVSGSGWDNSEFSCYPLNKNQSYLINILTFPIYSV